MASKDSTQSGVSRKETIRIPLVIRYPRLARAASTPADMALSLDVAPDASRSGWTRAWR